MDQDSPAKSREQKVSSQRTRWKILLLILCLLHGSSMTSPHRRPHSGELQAGSSPSRTPLCTMEAHRAPTPPCCWKNSLTGANALRGPRLVSGEPGGAVTIHCHYAPSSVNRHQRKYWCRLAPPLWTCYTVVSTNHYTHRDYRGRVALTDFPQSALFMVKLFRLSPNDTGLYRCGIGDRNDKLFFRMNLIVSPGPSNTTYAAASASGELITASSGIGSTAANRSTPGVTQIPEGQVSEPDRTAPTTANRSTPGVTQILEGQGSEPDKTAPTTGNRSTPGATQILEGQGSESDRTAPSTANRKTPGVTQILEGQGSEWGRIDPTTANRWTLGVTQILEGQGSEPGRTAQTTANRQTLGVTQILEGRGSAWDRTVPTTRISKTTVSANGRSTPRIAKTTVPGKSNREEGSIKATFPTPESPASKSRSMFNTTQGAWILGARNSVTTSASTSKGGRTGTVTEAEGPQEETEVSVSPGAPGKITGTTRPSVLISEPVTWETLQEATEDNLSKRRLLYSAEEASPDPSAWTLNATHMQVASGSIGRTLENTAGESSPPTPSRLSSGGPMWTPGKRSSMKSVFTEGESNTWILTPVSSVLALVLLAALVLLKRRPWRTSQKTERSPRITLIQMTHFLPDKLSDVGKSLQQGDPPAQASLTVLKKDSGP
ncbi:high affinity immunoglobulin alpha and immunoglobulin mu Fc receptor [Alexandromys fortis]|uniref:high affinity immunoglobulin alpha and immunoglobulin mu Fc receptor n=1 Tax=Alexandromys fortis TaxID=100897 RepID=UPI00215289EF|nr:high affinity immunoglobulin alpha and immunoglobulin mu Fc receptor [Microtus fortis]